MDVEPSIAAAEGRGPTLGLGVALFVVAAGLAIGLRPLTDNSFFTHLATGRLILDRGSVPSADPYTFTAQGEPWVVQSWLASVLYAAVERLGGAMGLRLLMGLVATALTLIVWRLTRAADGVVVRLAVSALVVAAGAGLWAERPFMLGLLALGAVALAAERDLDPRWLVPIGWLWVNVHGSFPLGLVYLLVLIVGRRLDGEPSRHELTCLGRAAVGMALGAVNPVGLRLLTFPAELLQRQDVLRNVIEWQAPTFEAFSQRAFLAQLAVAIVLLARRPRYRSALVVAVFGTAALLGARNLTVASLLFVPVMAGAAASAGSLRASARPRQGRVLVLAGLGALSIIAAVRLSQAPFRLEEYPIDAVAYLEEAQIDTEAHRMATPDVVGNLQELIYGPGRRVFYDDRFDMFPTRVSEVHLELNRSAATVRQSLAEAEVELVLWGRELAVSQLLTVDPAWRVLYTDESWMILCRRGVSLGPQDC